VLLKAKQRVLSFHALLSLLPSSEKLEPDPSIVILSFNIEIGLRRRALERAFGFFARDLGLLLAGSYYLKLIHKITPDSSVEHVQTAFLRLFDWFVSSNQRIDRSGCNFL
jgi:hypothetical protein